MVRSRRSSSRRARRRIRGRNPLQLLRHRCPGDCGRAPESRVSTPWARSPASLRRSSSRVALVKSAVKQRQVRLRLDEEEDAEAVALVGVQGLDRGGDGDRADDGVALLQVAVLAAHPHRHAVGPARLGPRDLHPLVVGAGPRVRGRRGRRSASLLRRPRFSAAWLPKTTSSVFGSTTMSGTCMVLSRFCFSVKAPPPWPPGARRLRSKPASRVTRRMADRRTGIRGRCDWVLGKRTISQVAAATWKAATAPWPSTTPWRTLGTLSDSLTLPPPAAGRARRRRS